MTFVSYAPQRQDAVLWRALQNVTEGGWIDVGPRDPDSGVTRAFYDRGWRGINVTSDPRVHALFRQFRPLDTNLRSMPLRELWEAHVFGPVHFLNLCADGEERAVLASLDLARQRPWIVLGAASTDGAAGWENALEAAGYVLGREEGPTRIFVAKERPEVLGSLDAGSAPDVVVAGSDHAATAENRLLRTQRDRLLEIVTSANGGFDARKAAHLGPYLDGPLPSLAAPASQLCTQSQLDDPLYRRWCSVLKEVPSAHRKQWEFVYIMQVLWSRGLLRPGVRGLGFGCGNEPLASAMAMYGCEVVATDLDPDDQRARNWRESDQHAAGKVEALNARGICRPDLFARRVTYRNVDMNHIPEDLRGFDFVWSSCALEHIGSIRHGLDFIRNAMHCLKPGGWAVHTTEFNLTSNDATLESPGLSFFRALDLETVAAELGLEGHAVAPFNLNPGDTLLDRYVDLPPFEVSAIHLRLRFANHTLTSVGMVVRKKDEIAAPRDAADLPGPEAYERALAPLVARIEADANDRQAFVETAALLESVGDFAGARQCLEVALDQNPKDASLWQALIDQSVARGDPLRAARDACDALAQLPADGRGDWHLRVARANLAGGAPADARDAVESGLAAFPGHPGLLSLQAALPRLAFAVR
jgi:2-polyprenyl-3-methyl-5-hydroxy-6-metoxy-1,4-benzoquinol methylase